MKSIKKCLFTVCCLVVATILVFPAKVDAAAKLSKEKVTITAGNVYDLRVVGSDNAVKWSTNNKNVAAVLDGRVYARKTGKATIKAKIDGKTLKCKITVKKYEESFRKIISHMRKKGHVGYYTSDNDVQKYMEAIFFSMTRATDIFVCDSFALLEYSPKKMTTYDAFYMADEAKKTKKFILNGSTVARISASKNNVLLLIRDGVKNKKRIISDFKKFK